MVRANQKIVFVTGKGGVGKSTVAMVLAKRYAELGKATLLVELGDRSYFTDVLGAGPVTYKPLQLQRNLDISLWSGKECLREYALHLLKIESLYRLFFENKVSKALIEIAPALAELAIMGKVTSGIRGVGPDLPYEVLVIDCFATGHMMALLRASRGMASAVSMGPMAEHSKAIDRVICDASICQYYIVSNPELLPVTESEELFDQITAEVKIRPRLILNKMFSREMSNHFQPLNAAEEKFSEKYIEKLSEQERLFERTKKKDPLTGPIHLHFENELNILTAKMSKDLYGR